MLFEGRHRMNKKQGSMHLHEMCRDLGVLMKPNSKPRATAYEAEEPWPQKALLTMEENVDFSEINRKR